jgi:hypothetical protein
MKQDKIIQEKTRIQFNNTKIWCVLIRKNQENIQETFAQPYNSRACIRLFPNLSIQSILAIFPFFYPYN